MYIYPASPRMDTWRTIHEGYACYFILLPFFLFP